MDLMRSQSMPVDGNSIIVRVAFPEFSIIKSVRCVKTLPIGEIKAVFHAQCKFEDDLYSIFIPAVDAKGVLGFAEGKWCDDAVPVKEYKLKPLDKLILARRIPTGKGSPTPDSKKNRRLSRRILGFFGASDGKSTSQSTLQVPQAQVQSQNAEASDGSGEKGSIGDDDQEFLNWANNFASRAGRSMSNVSADGMPSTVAASAKPVVPASSSSNVVVKQASMSAVRQRRMTFDMKNIGNLMSMEVESNPAERRRQLVSFLSRFLEARISVDELISSGIIDLEPPPALCDSPVRVDFVKQLFEWILKNGMVEGIFRISGPSQDVESMTSILNKGLMFDFQAQMSPHLVASVLKKYIRDRPFSTVPYRCYRSAILIHDSLPDKYAPFSVDECKSFIDHLPEDKQELFRMVLKYLKKVSSFKDDTKMGMSNLAIVFAPVLMRCRGDGLSLFSESDRQTDFLIRLIEVIDEISKEEPCDVSEVSSSVAEDKASDKPKRHKHHHHKHHKHSHSHSRSRRKAESTGSSPVVSPSISPVAPELSPVSHANSEQKQDETESKEATPNEATTEQKIETETEQKGTEAEQKESEVEQKEPDQTESASSQSPTTTDQTEITPSQPLPPEEAPQL